MRYRAQVFKRARVLVPLILLLPVSVASSTVNATPTPTQVPNGVYVFNTSFTNNLGLTFCTPESQVGCIESMSVGGVELQQVSTPAQASFYVGGGLYYLPCRFVATEATSCEAPYMAITRLDGAALTDGEVKFRRKAGTEPTSRIGAVVLSGALASFEPAAPGVRDVATIKYSAVETHHYQAGSATCRGWVIAIDLCGLGETANHKSINSVGLLMLPGMRSAVVPPDIVDPTCSTINPTGNCVVNVFEDASLGGWIDTSASVFGLASTDRFTGAAQLKIAAPHFKTPSTPGGTSTELNLATFRMFMTSEFLRLSFGLSPAQANASNLPVRRTLGFTSTTPTTQYVPMNGGLLVDTSGIGFSSPTMTLQRILVVKKNRKISSASIIAAAGVASAAQYGKATVAVTKRSGMKKSGSRFVFSKSRTVKVTVTYRSWRKSTATRTVTVRVTP